MFELIISQISFTQPVTWEIQNVTWKRRWITIYIYLHKYFYSSNRVMHNVNLFDLFYVWDLRVEGRWMTRTSFWKSEKHFLKHISFKCFWKNLQRIYNTFKRMFLSQISFTIFSLINKYLNKQDWLIYIIFLLHIEGFS